MSRGKSGQTRILAIGEVGDKTGGDRPREHCTTKTNFEYDFLKLIVSGEKIVLNS
jgi:hypothetical protein